MRAARVLAADPEVSAVGIVSGDGQVPPEYEAVSSSDLASWDVLATDGAIPSDESMPRWTVTSHITNAEASRVLGCAGACSH